MLRLILVVVGLGVAAALALFILATVWGVRFSELGVDGAAEPASSPTQAALDARPAAASAETPSAGTAKTSTLQPAATAAPRSEGAFTAPIRNTPSDSEPILSNTTASVRPLTTVPDARVPIETPRQAVPAVAAAHETPVSITIVEAAPTAHIYSALDTEVAAPVAAYPQSPVVATVFHDDEMLTFDVVIDQTGKVESVKLLHAPTSIRSTLMLTMSMSVAKAWRFMPATRHGQSVRYRQSISVPVSQ